MKQPHNHRKGKNLMITYRVKVQANGDTFWYLDDQLHREDDKPAREYTDGTKSWWLNGKLHREDDNPAVEYANGYKAWHLNGKLHRVNGPAIERSDGEKEFWIEGIKYSEEEFNEKMPSAKELTVAEVEKLLGHKVKIVK